MFTTAIGDAAGEEAPARARAAPAHLHGGETLREIELTRAEGSRLIALKEAVYGKLVDRAAFEWQYFDHPRSADFRVFVVEEGGQLIASTTRMPASIRLAGTDVPAYFNIDSMVHPAHRRRGCMRDLYKYARAAIEGDPIFFSKGSSAQIYPLLVSIGHHPVAPNTTLVSHPSAARWLLSRLHLAPTGQPKDPGVVRGFDDFLPIDRFGADFDELFGRVSQRLTAVFVRDAAYMNWRYVDIPHRRYFRYAKMAAGRMSGVVVASLEGSHANIVDLLWDQAQPGEPERTVRFVQALCDEHRAVRVTCFATHPHLREALLRAGFVDRGETPRFSTFVPPPREALFHEARSLHVVDGDGDTEFS